MTRVLSRPLRRAALRAVIVAAPCAVPRAPLMAQQPVPPVALTRAAAALARADQVARARALRLPLLLGGVGIETAAITSGRNLPYLGVGFALQQGEREAAALAVSELALMAGNTALRRRVPNGDLGRFPARDDSLLWRRGTGVSHEAFARYQSAALLHHTAYYLRMMDVSTSWRRAWQRSMPGSTLDASSAWRLLGAPVSPRDLGNAWVLTPIALAAGSAWLTRGAPRTVADMDSMTLLGLTTGRTRGTLLALGYEAATLLTTAVGEELFFRGMVQTEVSARAGHVAGMAASTTSFALFHLPQRGVAGTAIAGLAGVYLGERFRRTGGNLRDVVAMHFWIDFLPAAIAIVRDPRSARAADRIRWR